MEETNNFVQIKEQTFEEKVEMYMQCDKRKLAEMLAMRDMIEEQKNKEKENIVDPYFPNKSSLPYWYHKCKTWSDCVNPHYDCINCPLRGGIPINKKTEVTGLNK